MTNDCKAVLRPYTGDKVAKLTDDIVRNLVALLGAIKPKLEEVLQTNELIAEVERNGYGADLVITDDMDEEDYIWVDTLLTGTRFQKLLTK